MLSLNQLEWIKALEVDLTPLKKKIIRPIYSIKRANPHGKLYLNQNLT